MLFPPVRIELYVLALSLLVLRIHADDSDGTLSLNNLALFANRLD